MQLSTQRAFLLLTLACGPLTAACGGSGSSNKASAQGTGDATSSGGAGGLGSTGGSGGSATSTASATDATSTGGSGDGSTTTRGVGGSSTDSGAGGSSTDGGAGGTDGAAGGTDGGAAGAPADGGAGGTSSTNASGTGGSGGTGGGPTGVVAEPGSPCDAEQELGCAGNHQRVTLICSDGVWEVNETCPENHACDSTPGFDQGSCKERLPECVDQEPLQGGVCEDTKTWLRCGPDNVSLEPVECQGSCHDGACDDRPNHCPAEPFINCGSECGEFSPNCTEVGPCEGNFSIVHVFFDEPGQSQIVRIGDFDALCDNECETSETRGVQLIGRLDVTVRARITLPPSLRILVADGCYEDGREGCVTWDPNDDPKLDSSAFLGTVVTDDPAAAEQNILIETAAPDEVLDCP